MNMDIAIAASRIMAEESGNMNDICIHFMQAGFPVVCGRSAVLLNRFCPELRFSEISSSDGEKYNVIHGFPIEPVIAKFKDRHRLLVDDDHIRIINVQ